MNKEQSHAFDHMFPSHNQLAASGKIKCTPADFRVTEINDHITFTGEGEHLWLWIEKTDTNTDWVAKQLAQICQASERNIGYAGLKDRHAVTQQWFSVQLPKIDQATDIQNALPDEMTILRSERHNRKIKTGYLQGNRFELTVRDIEGDRGCIEANIQNVIDFGVPNYFGAQRFGKDMGNLPKAIDFFNGRFKTRNKNLKSLLISSARSHIFNNILAARIANNTWHRPIKGDVMQLNNSHSWFKSSEATSEEIRQRLKEKDIHISAALWGEDAVQSEAECAIFEQSIADQTPQYAKGFEQFRVKQDRRAVRMCPQNLKFEWLNGDLKLTFELPPGAYATVVLREILNCSEDRKTKA
ncbi:tRNA pseudouridine(13) synthase TruD [Marinicella rhabdoformis]|uniref:tRNA pseudouridine(13) synthase TruD n=1 Tax=Marinicella rhabdoformis TaxID=2580566 RepID=UPI0012AECB03|nr:tRNA pseudouridine(13) synthase TruD [Marinicella rhabdoformis]